MSGGVVVLGGDTSGLGDDVVCRDHTDAIWMSESVWVCGLGGESWEAAGRDDWASAGGWACVVTG